MSKRREATQAASQEAARLIINATEQFANGEVEFSGWREACATEIKMAHAFAYLNAIGGPDNMTDSHRRIMEDMIVKRLNSLLGLCVEFSNAGGDFKPYFDRVLAHADTHQTFENVRRSVASHERERRILGDDRHAECVALASLGWQPAGTLPPLAPGCTCTFELDTDTVEFYNADELRDEGGRWEGDGEDKPEHGKVMAALKKTAAGFSDFKDKLGDAEHAVAHAVSKRFARLPKPIQTVAKAILKTTFASYLAGQKVAHAIAEEKGGKEHADMIAGKLAALDIIGAKVVPLAAGALGPHAASVAYWFPAASTAYITYSAVRNPVATLRAAKSGISAALKVGKSLASKVHFDATTQAANILADAYSQHSENAAWYDALLAIALDQTRELKDAITLANQAYELQPSSPPEVDQRDDEVLFVSSYNPDEPRDAKGEWTKGGGVPNLGRKDPAANRPSKPEEREGKSPPPTDKPFVAPTSWPKNKNKARKAGKTTGFAANGMSNTTFGDMCEHLGIALGFRNILPEGKRSHASGEVEKKGSSLDVEWDHSGWASECKGVTVEGSEFKAKPKKKEVADKKRFAKMNKVKGFLTMPVVDTDKGIARFYWRDDSYNASLTPKNTDKWNYLGEVQFDPKPWQKLSELRTEKKDKEDEFDAQIKKTKDKVKKAALKGHKAVFQLEQQKKINDAEAKARKTSIKKVVH